MMQICILQNSNNLNVKKWKLTDKHWNNSDSALPDKIWAPIVSFPGSVSMWWIYFTTLYIIEKLCGNILEGCDTVMNNNN
jgi:hypothetical protein